MSQVISGGTGTICRNLGSGVLDLGLFFGFSVPTTGGIWLDMQKTETKEHEILSGSIDLTNLKVGSLYHYQYSVHQASFDLCGTGYDPASGQSYAGILADYYLKVRDIEVLSGSAQMCRSLYNTPPGAVVNLYDYVPGLADTNFIDPNEVEWIGPDGHVITPSGAQNYPIWGTAKDTTLTFSFIYSNECGKAPGNLYISVVDSLQTNKLHKKLQLCHTDDQASYVDLRQVLGIAGLKGTFTEESVPSGKTIVWIDRSKGVFNAFATFDNATAKETYTFKYTPDPSERHGCLQNDIEVSITVTRNVE